MGSSLIEKPSDDTARNWELPIGTKWHHTPREMNKLKKQSILSQWFEEKINLL